MTISKSVTFSSCSEKEMTVVVSINGYLWWWKYRSYKKNGVPTRILDWYSFEGRWPADSLLADARKLAAAKIKQMEKRVQRRKKRKSLPTQEVLPLLTA